MIKELGLVVTGVTIGVVGTLYVTKDFLIEGFAHKLSEVIDEEVQDMKDEIYNEQVEKDNKRDYTKPLRKSSRYPWGEEKTIKRSYSEGKDSKSFWVANLDTREEAESVLSELDEHIDIYGYATISDYYELVDIEHNYTDHQYGWTELSDEVVVPREHGYVVKLPVAKRLNK